MTQVDPGLVQPAADGLGVVEAEPAPMKVRGVELDRHGEVGAHRRPDRPDRFQEEPRTPPEATPPLVVPDVGAGREELGDKVTVGGVQLHAVEPGFARYGGRVREADYQPAYRVIIRRGRRPELDAGQSHRHGGRGHRVRIDPGVRLATGVRKLHPNPRTVAFGGTRPGAELCEALQVLLALEHGPGFLGSRVRPAPGR